MNTENKKTVLAFARLKNVRDSEIRRKTSGDETVFKRTEKRGP